jgi:hypothetical protein
MEVVQSEPEKDVQKVKFSYLDKMAVDWVNKKKCWIWVSIIINKETMVSHGSLKFTLRLPS